MIFFVTRKLSGTSDVISYIMLKRNIPVFRYNVDLFDQYQFEWNQDGFEIQDPTGRICKSDDVDIAIFYKNFFSVDEPADFDNTHLEKKWIKSWLNSLSYCFARYAFDRKLVRLWLPDEHYYTKILQMNIARKYFPVPSFQLYWGKQIPEKSVIAKSLTAKPLESGQCVFAKKVHTSELDSHYPWFTQDIADGNRDATIVYVNGNVHCYQFAVERGELTDWRVTQGTEKNKWEEWKVDTGFKQKVDMYMRELGLKFGRLDFIIGGKEPQFLEVNPCGQFGWLDDEKMTLHNEVVDAILDPSCTLTL